MYLNLLALRLIMLISLAVPYTGHTPKGKYVCQTVSTA